MDIVLDTVITGQFGANWARCLILWDSIFICANAIIICLLFV